MVLNERIELKNNVIKSLKELGFNDMSSEIFKLNGEKYSLYNDYIVYSYNGVYTIVTYKLVNDRLKIKLRPLKINKLENNINNPLRTKIKTTINNFIKLIVPR